ncbi:MAG: FAD-dependent oxidoreductase, partial [Steroidobacteraceae bacterium]
MTGRHTTIVGAGLAGSLMSILLGKRGVPVRLLERRPDLRKHDLSAGRSINLALSDRGIHALKQAGVYSAVEPLLTAMPGRCIHDLDGNTQFVSYGQRAHEVIYSVSRTGLNQVLLNEAEKLPTVDISFSVECHTADFTQQQLHLVDPSTGRVYREDYTTLIGADGSNSPLRQALLMDKPSLVSSELL